MSEAALVAERFRAADPRLGSTTLLCIDGPAGSGKTTLASAVAALTGAPVIRMDDLYPGWSGLFDVAEHVLGILAPVAGGRPGRYRRYDWNLARYAEEHLVVPPNLLILEGVGSGNRRWAGWASLLVWVEAADDVRLARGLARDGSEVHAQWLAWMVEEERLFATEGTRDRADLVFGT